MKNWIIPIVLLFSSTLTAQICFPYAHENVDRIMEHVEFLTSEITEGRAPGTQGDRFTREYIEQAFIMAGLEPLNDGGFGQDFIVYNPVIFPNSSMETKKFQPQVNEGFYPVRFSANGPVAGKTKYVKYAISAQEKKVQNLKRIKSLEGKIAVMNVSSPDGIHPHSAFLPYSNLQQRIDTLVNLGAIGIILINPDGNASDPSPEFRRIAENAKVPVVFVNDPAVAKYFKRSRKNVRVNVKMEEQPVYTANMVGFKNHHAANTIIIGAHHDHLGWGNSSSRYRGEPAIHPGADDNASGVAALLALADYFGQHDTIMRNNNIMFIAFGGEEMGLLGSKHWVKNPNIEIEMINYMINMDMIGRMDPEFQVVINGVGTSDTWNKFLEGKFCYQITPTLKPSGVGPSDHTSFYNVGVPVLHFYTGAHEDYHKPTDTQEKLNLEGIELIKRYIMSLVIATDDLPKLSFQQTDSEDEGHRRSPSFSVTMGVIPDYTGNNRGMRLDGVTSGKPADKAGLKTGDVLIRIGEFPITDVQSYMQALATFRKGQKVPATYLRNGKERTTEIVF
jgi:aminopeptidase YwaD